MSARPDITSVEAMHAWRDAVEGPLRRGDQTAVAALVSGLRPTHRNAVVVLCALATLDAGFALEAAGLRGQGCRAGRVQWFTALVMADDVPRPVRFAGQMVTAAANGDAATVAALAKTVVRIGLQGEQDLFGEVVIALVEIGSDLVEGSTGAGEFR